MLEMSDYTAMLMCHDTHYDDDMIYHGTMLVYLCQMFFPTA